MAGLFHAKNYSEVEILRSRLLKLAEAYGISRHPGHPDDEIVPAIERARSIKGPVVLDFVVEPEANVYPIVPPGASNSEMMLTPGTRTDDGDGRSGRVLKARTRWSCWSKTIRGC